MSHELRKFLCKATRESFCSVPQWPYLGSCKMWSAGCRGVPPRWLSGALATEIQLPQSYSEIRRDWDGWGVPSALPNVDKPVSPATDTTLESCGRPRVYLPSFPCARQGALSPASNPRYLVTRVSRSTCSHLGFPPLQMAITHLRGALKPSSLVPGFVNCFEQDWTDRDSWQLPCYLLTIGEGGSENACETGSQCWAQ